MILKNDFTGALHAETFDWPKPIHSYLNENIFFLSKHLIVKPQNDSNKQSNQANLLFMD